MEKIKTIFERPITKVIFAILFISVFAQITLTLPTNSGGIPITGQTFAVLLVAYALLKKWGTISIFLYELLGIFGAPVFADGKSGWAVITGGSGGFLIGFIVAAFFVGWLAEQGWSRNFGKSLLAMTLGTIIIMTFGVIRLAQLYDFEKALEWGFYPFIWGAIVKIILGAMIMPLYFRLTKR